MAAFHKWTPCNRTAADRIRSLRRFRRTEIGSSTPRSWAEPATKPTRRSRSTDKEAHTSPGDHIEGLSGQQWLPKGRAEFYESEWGRCIPLSPPCGERSAHS